MGFLPSVRRLRTDDLPQKYNDLTSKLVYGINQFFEAVYSSLNNGLSFAQNFNAIDTEITIRTPVTATSNVTFKNTLNFPIRALIVRRVDNLTDQEPLIASPFLEFQNLNGQVKITNAVGLLPNKEYRVRILCEP